MDIQPLRLDSGAVVLMLVIGTSVAALVTALPYYLAWRDGKRSRRDLKAARRRRRFEHKQDKRARRLKAPASKLRPSASRRKTATRNSGPPRGTPRRPS